MGALESSSLEAAEGGNKGLNQHLSIEEYAPYVGPSDEEKGIIHEQISANQISNQNLQNQMGKLSLVNLSENLDLDPSVVYTLKRLLDQIEYRERRIRELESANASVSKSEEAFYRKKQERLIQNAKMANDLHKEALDSQQKQQQEYEELLHKKEILESKNNCLKKMIEVILEERS